MYQGGFERNYPSLGMGTTSFIGTDGSVHPFPEWPAEIDGVRFGYLERRAKRFVVVRVQFDGHDVILRSPVVLDALRHLGGQRLSAMLGIADEVASQLLDDVLTQNAAQSAELALLINRVNQVRRGAPPVPLSEDEPV
jgi:hypothetical protein